MAKKKRVADHTPGPWNANLWTIKSSQGDVALVRAPRGSFTNKEAKANADLIASAPDMKLHIEELKAKNDKLGVALFILTNDLPVAVQRADSPDDVLRSLEDQLMKAREALGE